jgi:protein involved in polysaccharide export with SLBB domain
MNMGFCKKNAICLIFWAGTAMPSCKPTPVPISAIGSASDSELPDNTLGPNDVFDVRVYGEAELSYTFRVASDGTIDYPLLGTITVGGMSPTEVACVLEKDLKEKDYIKNPQVSVFVRESKSKKVSVVGEVQREVTFPYEEGMSIVEAISIAGGFAPTARENDTTVTRIVNGKKKLFHIPVKSISEGRSQNFILQPGDIIFVPARVF